jgi:hypothetical protein
MTKYPQCVRLAFSPEDTYSTIMGLLFGMRNYESMLTMSGTVSEMMSGQRRYF